MLQQVDCNVRCAMSVLHDGGCKSSTLWCLIHALLNTGSIQKHRPDKVSLEFYKLTWGCSCAIDTVKADHYMVDFLQRINHDYVCRLRVYSGTW